MTKTKPELSSSQEDYLETIFTLIQEKGAVRPKDIADRLNVRAASVTGALKLLAEKGLIHYAPYNRITLTEAGEKTGRIITEKHETLLNFFNRVLDIPREEADEVACKMEHIIPDPVLERFAAFARFVARCPNSGAVWRNRAHGYFCRAQGSTQTLCEKCQLEETD